VSRKLFLTLALAAIVTPAFAADYQTNLGPMPLDDETKLVIGGRGEATASSDGKTMTVKGSFHGLLSNATEAHVFISPICGVPGKSIFDLDVTKATSGTISGNFKLTGTSRRTAHRQALYSDQ